MNPVLKQMLYDAKEEIKNISSKLENLERTTSKLKKKVAFLEKHDSLQNVSSKMEFMNWLVNLKPYRTTNFIPEKGKKVILVTNNRMLAPLPESEKSPSISHVFIKYPDMDIEFIAVVDYNSTTPDSVTIRYEDGEKTFNVRSFSESANMCHTSQVVTFFTHTTGFTHKIGSGVLAQNNVSNYTKLEKSTKKSAFTPGQTLFYVKNLHQVEFMYEMLADKASREILVSRVKAALLRDNNYLCVSSFPCYFHPSIIYGRGSIVIDGGIFTEVEETQIFSHLVGPEGKIYAFEPSPASFPRASKMLEPCSNVEMIPKGLHERSCSMDLALTGASSRPVGDISNAATVESVSCEFISIDEFASENSLERVDVIKMDIEGSEFHAINGALKTIEKFRPDLAICLYHSRDKDFFRIFNLLNELQLGYKFYLGHHSTYVLEVVLYASAR